MRISAISETSSSSTQWASPQSKPAAASLSAASRQTAPEPAAQSSVSAGAEPAFAQVQSSVSHAETAGFAASYSTTVGGTSYSASIMKSGGVYTASVPMPPGLSASGTSIESAELNLNIVLDAIA